MQGNGQMTMSQRIQAQQAAAAQQQEAHARAQQLQTQAQALAQEAHAREAELQAQAKALEEAHAELANLLPPGEDTASATPAPSAARPPPSSSSSSAWEEEAKIMAQVDGGRQIMAAAENATEQLQRAMSASASSLHPTTNPSNAQHNPSPQQGWVRERFPSYQPGRDPNSQRNVLRPKTPEEMTREWQLTMGAPALPHPLRDGAFERSVTEKSLKNATDPFARAAAAYQLSLLASGENGRLEHPDESPAWRASPAMRHYRVKSNDLGLNRSWSDTLKHRAASQGIDWSRTGKKRQCPGCGHTWVDKYNKDECPKCLTEMSLPLWRRLKRLPGEASTFKEPPGSAMESCSGVCKQGGAHEWRFGRCSKCGRAEGAEVEEAFATANPREKVDRRRWTSLPASAIAVVPIKDYENDNERIMSM